MQTKPKSFLFPRHQHILWFIVLQFLICLFISFKSFGQTSSGKFNPDSSKSISLSEFNNLVNKSVTLLKTKKLSQISDLDHVNIMMCLNTIFMTTNKESFQQRFSGGMYQRLVRISNNKSYTRNIIKVYPDWVENSGEGFYFLKLRMELYGTPRPYAIFKVL